MLIVRKYSSYIKICVFIGWVALDLMPIQARAHPLKLSASLLEYNPNKRVLQLECKVFIDDFELSLKNSVLKNIDPSKLNQSYEARVIDDYFQRFYRIKLNDQSVAMKIVSTKPMRRQNVLVLRFEANEFDFKHGDILEIKNLLFFRDFGPAQTNRIVVRMPNFGIDDAHAATIYDYTLRYTLGDPS